MITSVLGLLTFPAYQQASDQNLSLNRWSTIMIKRNIVAYSFFQFYIHLYFNRYSVRQGPHTYCRSGMLATFSKNFYHEIRKSVHHLRVFVKGWIGIDHTQYLHNPFYLV